MGRFSLSKKYYFNFYASCGSTHKIEFAEQIHKKSGRVPDFLHPDSVALGAILVRLLGRTAHGVIRVSKGGFSGTAFRI